MTIMDTPSSPGALRRLSDSLHLDARKYTTIVVFGLLAAVPLISAVTGDGYIVTQANRIIIMALFTVGLDLVLGYGGLVSFGHAAFYGLGGYTVAILAYHHENAEPILGWASTNSALVTLPLAMLVSGLAATIIGWIALRTRGVHFIMITLAFAQMIYFVFVGLKYYGGDDGLILNARNTLPGVNLSRPIPFYWLSFCLLTAVGYGLYRITESRFGMVLSGARSSERRMRALGFDVDRHRLVAFAISGAIAGLAGALTVQEARFASPELLGWMKSGEVIVMAVLGGSGTLIGPVVGAAAFILLETSLATLTEHWMLILGPFLVLVVLVLDGGLVRLIERIRR